MDDAIGYLVAHPAMFFRRGSYTPEELAGHVVRDALLSGVTDLTVTRLGSWWTIEGGTDWLDDEAALDWFRRLVPFPQGGQNASRSEVLVTAFANDVVTVGGAGDRHVVKGSADDDVLSRMASVPRGGRLIAFR